MAPQQSLMRAALLLLMEGLLAGGSVVLGFGAPAERNGADQRTSRDCMVLNFNPFATDLKKSNCWGSNHMMFSHHKQQSADVRTNVRY